MEVVFAWDDKFTTGVHSVDEQHQTLVYLFNELHQAVFSNEEERNAILEDVYARLLSYVDYHFSEEEELMRRSDIDPRHIEMHCSMHRQFVDQLHLLWAQRKYIDDPISTFVGFLTSWLGLHILGTDQTMARQIQLIEQGMTPAEAFDAQSQGSHQDTEALLKMIGRLYRTLSDQNAQLVAVNLSLEERVAQRTQELSQANERLSALARTDALLGIANRAYFNERIEQACALAMRGERSVGIVMLDVDFFKRYNDQYGHLQGDACLQAVAKAVDGCLLRNSDLLARYGGEELVVLLHDTDLDGALVVANKIVEAVRNLGLEHSKTALDVGCVTISAGASAGIPHRQASGASPSSALLARADEALYRAKELGRNQAQALW